MDFIKSLLCCHVNKNTEIEMYFITNTDVVNAIDDFFYSNAPNVKYTLTWNTNRLPCTITYLLNSIFEDLRNNTKTVDIHINSNMVSLCYDGNPFQEVNVYCNSIL